MRMLKGVWGHLSRNESWPPRGTGLNCFPGKLNYETASSVRAKYVMLEPKFCSYFGRLGLRLRQLRVFTKKAVICNKSCMGTFLSFGHTLHNAEQNVFFLLLGVSQRPQVPRELWHCSRANFEHTLAISMFLSPSISVAKLLFLLFRAYQKRPSDYRGHSELVRLFGVCSGFSRSSFGVRSEFVRSSFGVRSELVRSELVRSCYVCFGLDLLPGQAPNKLWPYFSVFRP